MFGEPEQLYLSSKFKLPYDSVVLLPKPSDALEKGGSPAHSWEHQGPGANLV